MNIRKTLIAVIAIAGVGAVAGTVLHQRGDWQSPEEVHAVRMLVDNLDLEVHGRPQPVAEFTFLDADGNPLTLEDFRGMVLLLNLWATWCAPCIHEMPALDRLEAKLGGDDFKVVALSQDRGGLQEVAPFWDEVGLEHLAIYLDETSAAARGVAARGLPTTLLINRNGAEVARLEGPAEWDSPEAVEALRQFVAN